MELQLVSKKVAILAKELGFDWEINHYTFFNEEMRPYPSYNIHRENFNKIADYVSVPEQELLAKWLRDVHKLHIGIMFNGSESFYYWIKEVKVFGREWDSTDEEVHGWKNYEEAMEVALLCALNDLRSQGD